MSTMVIGKRMIVPSLQECAAAPVLPQSLPQAVADRLTPTIFHEPWWLDIVTGGDYAVAEVKENGAPARRLHYFPRKRLGMTYSILPPMTHFLGPAITEGEGNPSTRFLRRARITQELIGQLPSASIYHYKCHREVTDAIAFQQERFHTAVQFTFEVFPDTEEALWKNLRGEKRKKIRSAQRAVSLSHIQDPLEFWGFYDDNLRKKGVRNVCDRNICCRMIEACLTRDRGRIYAARDKNGSLAAAVLCVWDDTSSFYFMSSRTQEAHHGAISLLAWEAMKEAAARGLIFDFDGLNNSKSVLFFTEFGGVISPRYIVTRYTLAGGLAWEIKNMRRENRYFF